MITFGILAMVPDGTEFSVWLDPHPLPSYAAKETDICGVPTGLRFRGLQLLVYKFKAMERKSPSLELMVRLCCSWKADDVRLARGYIPWWNEFPGMHIPAPLEIGSCGETDIRARAEEILALTKMNWNSSDGITRFPITLLFARRVGELMCELSDNATPNPSYRFYI